ncbi:MAG: hypothetical protein JWM28_1517 [Chitinophagaceae bacterium]|nr:hypothetical protein [Chitinophagaceae bacterium]
MVFDIRNVHAMHFYAGQGRCIFFEAGLYQYWGNDLFPSHAFLLTDAFAGRINAPGPLAVLEWIEFNLQNDNLDRESNITHRPSHLKTLIPNAHSKQTSMPGDY